MQKIKKIVKPKKKTGDVTASEGDMDGIELAQKDIEDLSKLLEANLNYWKTFKISLVRGFGAALGATIIVATIIYLLDRFFSAIGYIPILTPLLEYIYHWIESV